MEDETSTETAARQALTLSQVVAWNMARYRRIAGMTQKELGDLIGWSNLAVSEAERSWDGKRVRVLDAQTIGALSLALGVPLIALFLPPDEDEGTRYAFAGPDEQPYGMADLMTLLVMPDSGSDSAAMEAYRERLRAAAKRYLDPEWADELADWLRETDDDDAFDDRAALFRARQAELARAAEELGDLASAIERRGRRR